LHRNLHHAAPEKKTKWQLTKKYARLFEKRERFFEKNWHFR